MPKGFLGDTQIRTGDQGFAIQRLTTWPYRLYYNKNYDHFIKKIKLNFFSIKVLEF